MENVCKNTEKGGKFGSSFVCSKAAKAFSFRGALLPDPVTRGYAPGLHWGLCRTHPVIGWCSALTTGFDLQIYP